MQKLTEYLKRAAKFDKFAAVEKNKTLKRRYVKIAKRYHALAAHERMRLIDDFSGRSL